MSAGIKTHVRCHWPPCKKHLQYPQSRNRYSGPIIRSYCISSQPGGHTVILRWRSKAPVTYQILTSHKCDNPSKFWCYFWDRICCGQICKWLCAHVFKNGASLLYHHLVLLYNCQQPSYYKLGLLYNSMQQSYCTCDCGRSVQWWLDDCMTAYNCHVLRQSWMNYMQADTSFMPFFKRHAEIT